ncbi:unnamed protein product [Cercopithifilaria johnstoni]|uniref:Cyclin N-terminal domain-containing protein n=1 Tax=Cercopithifilaria johnstoni TaxID=2874296 RepID=A0A8J2Q8K8_9BILA|nr:unnamed protein product [Cercopithifilaria johnstoni]
MDRIERKRRSFLPKTTQASEPPIKFCRITEENCRSAKIIKNECRLSDNAKSYPESSTSTLPNVNFYNDPSNFLSCSCLGSPQQVWHSLCESREKDNERKSEKWKKLEVKGIRSRITTLLTMIQLCEYMKYRRETYHRAIDIFDRIMAVFDFEAMNKSEIIFTGIFAVFIASKVEERQKNHWRTIADYISKVSPCDRMKTENMFDLEMRIITNVNWSFRTITALEWAKIYAHMTRVYTTYKRIHNLSLAHQSTPTKKRTKIAYGVSDDQEVDFFTWAQLDDLVIGEPSSPVDLCNRIAIAQVVDLCMIDLYNFNFTYRQLGAAACVSVFGLDYEIALRITGLKMKDLRPALDFVNSHRRIYMKYVHKEGANIAFTRGNDLLHFFSGLDEDEEIEVIEIQDEASKISESTQTLLKWMPEIEVLAPQSYPKKKTSHKSSKISGITDKVSESTREISEKQGPSNTLSKFRRKSSIFVSDLEVSLLEINVNSPNFRDISMEANIPEQQRLRILSPESGNKERICKLPHIMLKKKAQLPGTSAATVKIFSHPPPFLQVPANKKCGKIIEMECGCGCGQQSIIENMNELEKMISSLTYHKGKGEAKGKIFVTKRNQQGEIKIRREIPIPHPTEAMEKQMAQYYTQCFPLEAHTTMRVIKRLQRFWMECGNRQLSRRRHSHSVLRQYRCTNRNRQRRKSK